MKRSGTADLPLHYGKVPHWLADRMKEMGGAIALSIVHEYGREEFLRRISDPFWFQAFGAVMGMDWHSSGITPSVMYALKRALGPISHETGIYILGGRGKYSRNTPDEITEISMKTGLNADKLIRCSKLSAKIDNSCIDDGCQIYLHNFILTDDGKWAVVQQGMNTINATARRYHWLSENIKSFVDNPHTAIEGTNQGEILNLIDAQSKHARDVIVEFLSLHPDKQLREIRSLFANSDRNIKMPSRHNVIPKDVNSKRMGGVLALAYEQQFKDFTDILLLKGIGPRTIQALALVSEVIYGAPVRFSDPARFSFAHGGKDGHPAPVPIKVYDETISVLKKAVSNAKIGNRDRLTGLKKLNQIAYHIENNYEPDTDINKLITHERKISKNFGGRTVFDKSDKKAVKIDAQLKLF
jgi:hypothetical protein